MATFALIKDDTVKNIIVLDDPDDWALGDSESLVPTGPGCMIMATYDGETFTPPPVPEREWPGAEVVIKATTDAIDTLCDTVYTTSTSRDRRYANKRAESERYLAAGSPETIEATDYPYLAREAPKRAISYAALAALIIQMAKQFDAFGAAAEAARVDLAVQVKAADPSKRQTVAGEVFASLQAKVPAS